MVAILIISLIILGILIISLLSVKKSFKIEKAKAPSPIKTKTIYFVEDIKDIGLVTDLIESVVGVRICEITPNSAKLIIVNKDEEDKDTLIKQALKKANIKIK